MTFFSGCILEVDKKGFLREIASPKDLFYLIWGYAGAGKRPKKIL
jgi:hypothetical protein